MGQEQSRQNSHPQPSAIPPSNSQQPLQSGSPPKASDNTQLEASILDCIPQDIWVHHIAPHLHHSDSYVWVITGKPSQEQTAKIITKTKLNVVHGYLLIKYPENINNNNSKTTYALGYYNQEGEYCEPPVSEKSSLHNYLSNNPVILDNSAKDFVSNDPDLLRWVSRAVKEKGGQLANSGVLNLSLTNKANLKFFEPNRKQEYFQILFDAVVRSEYDRAERILKSHPELLLSNYKGSITDTGIAERTFHNTTVFQLAVWGDDWQMYNMMLKCIPKDEKTIYKDDLKKQYEDLQRKGLTYTLNNLKACGLRILDDEPNEEIKEDVIKRNAYLFIIDEKNKTYSLGFKDPNPEKYTQCVLDQHSDLSKQADILQQALDDHRDINGLPHCIIRDEVILELVRQEIQQHGGQTEITVKNSRSHDLTPLLNALQKYKDQFDNWAIPKRTEHWCIIVGWAQRLLPAAIWNYWVNPNIRWATVTEKDFALTLLSSYRPMLKSNGGISLLPLLHTFGDKHAFATTFTHSGDWFIWVPYSAFCIQFVKSFIASKDSKVKSLIQDLGLTPPTNKQSSNCLMM